MTVVILGSGGDRQVQRVGRELDARGVEWDVWDSDHWPGEQPLSFEETGRSTALTVCEPVDLQAVDAVYFRRISFDPTGPGYEDELDDRPYSLLNQLNEYRGLVLSMLQYLDATGTPVVNPPMAMQYHSMKPYQLSLFAEHDLPVPETLTTNDPAAVEAFVDRVGTAIYKPVSGGGHARGVTADDLSPAKLDRLANAPVQFQERLDGTDLRLFVVDGEVVAAGYIHSDELDYRRAEHEVERVDPDPEIASAAVRAADILDLPFTGVDVVVGDDGFTLLEANPSPMFAVFDELAGTDVAGRLADFLVP